jgi:hypothetical protein
MFILFELSFVSSFKYKESTTTIYNLLQVIRLINQQKKLGTAIAIACSLQNQNYLHNLTTHSADVHNGIYNSTQQEVHK